MSAFGFLLIDKPEGITSFDVIRKLKKSAFFKGLKLGHTGTLDPLATGLLIVAFGKATRLTKYLQKLPKVYEVKALLGFKSDTYDLDGNVEKLRNVVPPSQEDVEGALLTFKGTIRQTPPKFSAVRVKGKRAYELARNKQDFTLPQRTVQIYDISLKSYCFPEVDFVVFCSSGTYVRSLVNDLGKKLKVGAVVGKLRRLQIGNINVLKAQSLEEAVEKPLTFPPQDILSLPLVELDNERTKAFLNGRFVLLSRVYQTESRVSVVDSEKNFLGVGVVKSNMLKPEVVLK